MLDVITPNWPAPEKIKAFSTTRNGGFSNVPFNSLNLAHHVEDNSENIKKNRALLRESLQLPAEPFWINQTHSTIAVEATQHSAPITADASYTQQTNNVCAILTADCLPILLCDRKSTTVAAIHAGWRGLANGIIEQTIKQLKIPSDDLLVWLGPAIGPEKFEVGEEVLEKFITPDPQAEIAFKSSTNNRWLANLYTLAKQRLAKCEVTAVYGGDYCTYSDDQRFFSYRRDKQTGRMASIIWIGE